MSAERQALEAEVAAIRQEVESIRAVVMSERLLQQTRQKHAEDEAHAAHTAPPATATLKGAALSKAERQLLVAIRTDAASVTGVAAASAESAVQVLTALAEHASVTAEHVLTVAMPACGASRPLIDAFALWLDRAYDALCRCVCVTTLDLESNRFSSDDLIALAALFARLPRLRVVRLANQQRETINANARRAIVAAVLRHSSIEKLTCDLNGAERSQIESHLTANAREHAKRDANEKMAARRAAEALAAAAASAAPVAAVADAPIDWKRRAELAEALLKSSEAQHAHDVAVIATLRRDLHAEQATTKALTQSLAELTSEKEALARQLADATQRAALARHTIGELERRLERRAHANVSPRPASVETGADEPDRIERIVAQQRQREEQQKARDAEAAAAEAARVEAARLAAIERVRAAPSAQPAPVIEIDNRATWRKTSGGWEAPEVGPVAVTSHSNSNNNTYMSPVTLTTLPLVWLDMLRFRDALTSDDSFVCACQTLATLVSQFAATAAKRTVDRLVKLVKLAAAVAHRSVWVTLPDAHGDADADTEAPSSLSDANLGLALPILSRAVLRETFSLLSQVEEALRHAAREIDLGALSPLMAAASFELVVRAPSTQLLRDADRVREWRRSLESVWTANLRSCLDWGDAPIPRLVLETIFSNLESVDDLLQCRAVSRAWYAALHDDSLIWRAMVQYLQSGRVRGGRGVWNDGRLTPRAHAVRLWRARGSAQSSLAFCTACGMFVWARGDYTLAVRAASVVTAAQPYWFHNQGAGACPHARLAMIPPRDVVGALMNPPKQADRATGVRHW